MAAPSFLEAGWAKRGPGGAPLRRINKTIAKEGRIRPMRAYAAGNRPRPPKSKARRRSVIH